MYPFILEEYNVSMPPELSSTVTPHQNPKYKQQGKGKQTLYGLKPWLNYHFDIMGSQSMHP
jgi:hypothetical protein